ncbi:rho-related GTP-binding protein RhoA-D isoform X4 [Eurytemora carolleeae]|uniref:rho-related GTP-binding protein RhoA-D isoform X4 n=1 Tax=Eurytemora carolleeae TaxID=1294199 RepID=UPI000C786949|nr:rho-related GTP-binding protein RhoA-D isoform X4 [Eurytemora carolleeae]|eukprot:XP_023333187.1 rho-related GTP-binding protein RhoA-D-like isoform X4 [Eurytemora affinis]
MSGNTNSFETRTDGAPAPEPVNRNPGRTKFKFVIIGDGAVGKTSVCQVFKDKKFSTDMYIPTIFENHTVDLTYLDKVYQINLSDTAGQEQFDRIRRLQYPGTDVFLVCFSLASKDSFENVKNVWLPEINQANPNAIKLLVGTKSDLVNPALGGTLARRFSRKTEIVMKRDVEKLLNRGLVDGLIDCSAKLGSDSIDPVFKKVDVLRKEERRNEKNGVHFLYEKYTPCIIKYA